MPTPPTAPDRVSSPIRLTSQPSNRGAENPKTQTSTRDTRTFPRKQKLAARHAVPKAPDGAKDESPAIHRWVPKPNKLKPQRGDTTHTPPSLRLAFPAAPAALRMPDPFPQDRLPDTQSTNNTCSEDLGFEVRSLSSIHRPNLYDLALRTHKEYDDAFSYIHVNPVRRGSHRMIEAVPLRFIFLLWP